MGDPAGEVWAQKEVIRHLTEGMYILATETQMFLTISNLDDVSGQALYDLPADFHRMDRVTWDNEAITPLSLAQVRLVNAQYRDQISGDVRAYSVNAEGFRKLRKYPPPSVDTGLRRDRILLEEFGTPDGSITAPDRFRIGALEFGLSGNLSEATTVIEYRATPELQESLDLPVHLEMGLDHYVRWQCFARSGLGQDLKLAAHFRERWEIFLARAIQRRDTIHKHRLVVVGRRAGQTVDPRRPRLPDNFGTQTPVTGGRY